MADVTSVSQLTICSDAKATVIILRFALQEKLNKINHSFKYSNSRYLKANRDKRQFHTCICHAREEA